MSQPQPIITEEPQPQGPPGFQQPLPGQYPQEYPLPAQPMMQPPQPVQPMMQPAQPVQPMMQPGQPVQPMMHPGQPVQPMIHPGQHVQPMMHPIQMQPMQQTSNTTNVVMINQQKAAPAAPREWSTGLCGCFDDFGTCCFGILCSGMVLADISQRLGEGRCFPCCCPNALLSLRIKFRAEQNIQGSLCNDYIEVGFCYFLALCQLAREVDYVQRTHLQRQ